jgi:hypothetical protein
MKGVFARFISLFAQLFHPAFLADEASALPGELRKAGRT